MQKQGKEREEEAQRERLLIESLIESNDKTKHYNYRWHFIAAAAGFGNPKATEYWERARALGFHHRGQTNSNNHTPEMIYCAALAGVDLLGKDADKY